MKIGFELTDYKIQSERIYKFTLVVFALLLSLFLILESVLQFKTSSFEILIPFSGALLFIILLAIQNPKSKVFKILFLTILYSMIESHFIYQPNSFHTVIFWLPFVPLMALIVSGSKSSIIWIGIVLLTNIFNGFYLADVVGDSYNTNIFRLPALAHGIVFMVAISTNSFILYHLLGKAFKSSELKKKEIENIKTKIDRKRSILESYMREFVSFSKEDSHFNQGQEHLFKSICTTISSIFNINRISIWLFDEEGTKIQRRYLYEYEVPTTNEFVEINEHSYPRYFEALRVESYIIANNARTHKYTIELTEDYLEPLNIYSLLDCPIMVDRKPIGIICCEQKNEMKYWNIEDALFLQSISDFISMSFKNQRIERLMAELKQTNSELKLKNREIEVMNAALDTTVQKRTKALKSQNARITEYSFINSHLVRAPLTRILGLSNHLVDEATSIKEHQLFDALINSTEELDSILRKINDLLYEENGLTREDLNSLERSIRN